MSVKIISLCEKEIRDIGDAFADFQYAESEFGMGYLGKDRQAVSDYICAYVRMSIKERILYSNSENHEAFIAFKNPGVNMSLKGAAELLKTIPGCVDTGHLISTAKGLFKSGKSYGDMLSKLKIPHIYVGMVAVRKEYQGKGFMRKLLEIAFEEGRRQAVPDGPPYFCHSKRNTSVSRTKHVQFCKHRHCRDFYEIINETYITIIEIVNATFMGLGMLEMQINTGF